ncbi:MAG: AmmeMemoRadiSam system radical SAM enzyme, partial [Thermodesulfobacteriota bacterium]
MDRRDFLKTAVGTACLLSVSNLRFRLEDGAAGNPSVTFAPEGAWAEPQEALHEASYYKKLEHKEVQCLLCPRKCVVGDQERGYCGVRENRLGTYYTLVYNRPCTARPDPIEKKPFYHFRPRSLAYSLATAGCNMNCKYCQNWEISQVRPEQVRDFLLTARDCARQARDLDCISIAYTYTEPVIFWEYMYDIAAEARKAGIKNVMISGGFVEEKPLRDLLPLMDAVKIDLKAFSDKYYREVCRGRLEPVLEALKIIREAGVWLEIVYLVLPTLNDSSDEIRALSAWIRKELGPDVPIHLTRFHPTYLMKKLPPTPVDTLERLKKIAQTEGLHYVYIGNVPGHSGKSTLCPECGALLVHRTGYNVRVEALRGDTCEKCGLKI